MSKVITKGQVPTVSITVTDKFDFRIMNKVHMMLNPELDTTTPDGMIQEMKEIKAFINRECNINNLPLKDVTIKLEYINFDKIV